MKTVSKLFPLLFVGGFLAQSCSKSETEPLVARGSVAEQTLTTGEGQISSHRGDSLALVALYDQLGGVNWYRRGGWKSERPIAEWQGVQVAQVAGESRVVALRLGANNLKGTLPRELGYLQALKSLDLGYNVGITGGLISEIYQLGQLRALYLRHTSVTGMLSEELGNLTELDTLDLKTSPWVLAEGPRPATIEELYAKNTAVLTGTLPVALGKLHNLRYLDLQNQGFSGKLPEQIGGLVSAEFIDLSSNELSGSLPASLGKLQRVRTLFLGYNHFSGSIPSELSACVALYQLYLDNNELSGSIPASLGSLPKLGTLSLEHNQLTGQIPQTLATNKSLYLLYLNDNQLSGTIPQGIGGAGQRLIRVALHNNQLTGSAPKKETHSLVINGMRVTGYTHICISGNRLTGELPAEYDPSNALPQQPGYGFDNVR